MNLTIRHIDAGGGDANRSGFYSCIILATTSVYTDVIVVWVKGPNIPVSIEFDSNTIPDIMVANCIPTGTENGIVGILDHKCETISAPVQEASDLKLEGCLKTVLN